MGGLRMQGGISGFPRREESAYDAFGTAHSSTSISAALGMARAAKQKGEARHTIAVIGDGAISAGMAFEGMNNAGVSDANLLVVLNDNEMSISPAVGAMNRYLARLVSGRAFTVARNAAERVLARIPRLRRFFRRFELHAKGMVVPSTLFEHFGFNYIGPIDGHDLEALIPTLRNVRNLKGPQLLHVVTRKGQGYKLAEADPVLYHGVSKFEPAARMRGSSASRRRCARARGWSNSRSGFRIAITMWGSPSNMRSRSPRASPARD
jgi:1-deoxy-D-xylulose-5-phosphate synthase